jgi:RNA polymerase sigma-70 factor, ECF subfamily
MATPPVDRDAAQIRLAELLSATALRDRSSFAELYRLTKAKLFGVSLRIVRERHLAEEVLQDSFVNIWNHASDYASAKSAPLTWMTAIVRNRSLDIVRRGGREIADEDDRLAATIEDPGLLPIEATLQKREAHDIQRCMMELEAEQRQSIALAFFHGLSHGELALHLGKPLGTIKTHIRRGLMRLRSCLGQ